MKSRLLCVPPLKDNRQLLGYSPLRNFAEQEQKLVSTKNNTWIFIMSEKLRAVERSTQLRVRVTVQEPQWWKVWNKWWLPHGVHTSAIRWGTPATRGRVWRGWLTTTTSVCAHLGCLCTRRRGGNFRWWLSAREGSPEMIPKKWCPTHHSQKNESSDLNQMSNEGLRKFSGLIKSSTFQRSPKN